MSTQHHLAASPEGWHMSTLPADWRLLLILDAVALLLPFLLHLWWSNGVSDADGGNAVSYFWLIALGLTPVFGVPAGMLIGFFRDRLFPRHLNSGPPAIFAALAFFPIALLGLFVGMMFAMVVPEFFFVIFVPPTLLFALYLGWFLHRRR